MSEQRVAMLTTVKKVAPQSSRGRERHARILSAATELFLRDGYAETSIDSILELSGGSKATLYSYFPTKDDLFRAVIDAVVSNRFQPQFDVLEDIRSTLIEYCVQRLGVIFSAHHRALLRVVVAERPKFPELAQMYYERGPRHSRKPLIDYLDTLREQRSLMIEDADEAANFLISMILHEWYIQSLLLGGVPPDEAAMRHRTERAVDRFLAAYQ